VQAASTKPSSAARGTGSSTNARIDRRASRNAGTRLTPPPHTLRHLTPYIGVE
jgi:hypothetical protein